MHFQMFFPGKTNNAPACLRSVGLADFVDGASEKPVMMNDGANGLLVGWGEFISYLPDEQSWTEADGYRIGFWNKKPVVPADLARRSLFPGFDLKLGDGNLWKIPVAAQLPSTYKLIDGRWASVRKPQFLDFWNQSETWFRRLMVLDFDHQRMADDAGMGLDEFKSCWVDFVVFTLRQNYRINAAVVSELGLIDDWNLAAVTMAVVDGMHIQSVTDELKSEIDREAAGLPKKETESVIPDS